MHDPKADTMYLPKAIISNRKAISTSIDAGTFAEVLADWDLDDLALLAMELKRVEMIGEIVAAKEVKIIKAIERLGWGDILARELEEANA